MKAPFVWLTPTPGTGPGRGFYTDAWSRVSAASRGLRGPLAGSRTRRVGPAWVNRASLGKHRQRRREQLGVPGGGR